MNATSIAGDGRRSRGTLRMVTLLGRDARGARAAGELLPCSGARAEPARVCQPYLRVLRKSKASPAGAPPRGPLERRAGAQAAGWGTGWGADEPAFWLGSVLDLLGDTQIRLRAMPPPPHLP